MAPRHGRTMNGLSERVCPCAMCLSRAVCTAKLITVGAELAHVLRTLGCSRVYLEWKWLLKDRPRCLTLGLYARGSIGLGLESNFILPRNKLLRCHWECQSLLKIRLAKTIISCFIDRPIHNAHTRPICLRKRKEKSRSAILSSDARYVGDICPAGRASAQLTLRPVQICTPSPAARWCCYQTKPFGVLCRVEGRISGRSNR